MKKLIISIIEWILSNQQIKSLEEKLTEASKENTLLIEKNNELSQKIVEYSTLALKMQNRHSATVDRLKKEIKQQKRMVELEKLKNQIDL